MEFIDHPIWLFCTLFAVLAIVLEAGFLLRSRWQAAMDDQYQERLVGARDSIVVLLSLLLGFTFPMAVARYDQRRLLVIEEADAIATANLRAGILPELARARSHDLLVQYTQARLDFFAHGMHANEMEAAFTHAKQLQNALWHESLPVAQSNPSPVTALYLHSLNTIMELSEESQAALENRMPAAIWFALWLISLVACVTVGFSLQRRAWFSILIMPLTISIVMTLIADLDSPRHGLILVGRQSMERVQSDLKLPY